MCVDDHPLTQPSSLLVSVGEHPPIIKQTTSPLLAIARSSQPSLKYWLKSWYGWEIWIYHDLTHDHQVVINHCYITKMISHTESANHTSLITDHWWLLTIINSVCYWEHLVACNEATLSINQTALFDDEFATVKNHPPTHVSPWWTKTSLAIIVMTNYSLTTAWPLVDH